MSSKAAIPRRVRQLPLPPVGNRPVTGLHTVLVDDAGAVYYSDEFNHAVVSLDANGKLRWSWKAPKEENPGFFYPRGLSLGRILVDGNSLPCIAVCDSWKQRVQIFDLDGKWLTVWKYGNAEKPFSEVNDVRFIKTGSEPSAGYWIVLDGGRHCIHALGQNGQPLFEVGREFPTNLCKRWVAPGIALEEEQPAGLLRPFPPFDFLYYPVRILGNCEEALYLYEATSSDLKKLFYGNLFPIHLDSVKPSVRWINADSRGFLGFDQESKGLFVLDQSGRARYETVAECMPIASNLPLSQFCTQAGDQLNFWIWDDPESFRMHPADILPNGVHWPLVSTAFKQMQLNDGDIEALRKVTSAIDAALDLADELLDPIPNKKLDTSLSSGTHEKLTQWIYERSKIIESFQTSVHHWCVGLLEAALLADAMASEDFSVRHQGAIENWRNFLSPLYERFSGVQLRLDRIAMLQSSLTKEGPEKREWVQDALNVLHPLQDNLLGLREWIQRWCGIPDEPSSAIVLSEESGPHVDGELLCRPKARDYEPVSSYLIEKARYAVYENRDMPSAKPRSLAITPDGDLLISLSQAHRIVRMNESGQLIGTIGKQGSRDGELLGPSGLALDDNNLLWISEYQNNRIQVFNLLGVSLQILDPIESGLGPLNGPSGLQYLPGEGILAADYCNHRILRISPEGRFSDFANRVGRDPEANWYPISFARGSQGNFWLVDQGNHRAKEMRPDGSILRIVGGCGLGRGDLFLPITAAVFEDEVLAIAQAQPRKLLKLFSPSGMEMCRLLLSYHPAAMVVHKERLYIAGYDDGFIHVYERP
jgi:hypothetical protein